MQPPPLASPVYNGNTASATLDESNAASMGFGVQQAIDLTASVPERVFPVLQQDIAFGQAATFDDAQHIFPQALGQINADGTGWIETTFQNHPDGGNGLGDFDGTLPDFITLDLNPVHGAYTLSGTVVYQYLSTLSAPTMHVLVSYTNFTITGKNLNVTLNGSIDSTFVSEGGVPVTSSEQATANLSIHDAILGRTWLLKDFSVTSTLAQDPPRSYVQVSGIFSDSVYGTTTVSTPNAPLSYFYNVYNLGPSDGGYVRLQGAGGKSVYFGSINYYLASIAVDTTGAGYPNAALRYSWATGKPDAAPAGSSSGPAAIAEIEKSPAVNDPGFLDGRLSYSKAGDFVSYAWSVELAQPDSHPTFDHPDSAMPAFTVDRPGDYLVKLVVSDGTNTSTDRVVVHALSSSTVDSVQPQGKSGPSNMTGQVGQPLTFDGRLDNADIQASPRPKLDAWVLTVPAGSSAALDDPQSPTPTFTPDVDGYYTLSDNQAAAVTVAVGEPFQFAPLMQFLSPSVFDYVPVDIDGDGKIDFVYSLQDGFGVPQEVGILKNQGQGIFSTSQTFDIGLSRGSLLDAGDLNGDGLPDIAVNTGTSVTLLMQQPDGSFKIGSSLTACSGTSGGGGTSLVKLAKIANDTVDSILYSGCSSGVTLFRNDGHGNFTTGATFPDIYNFSNTWQAGDVTGDGITDVVGFNFTLSGSSVNTDVVVYPGKADGTFDTPVLYPFSGSQNPIINGNGPGPIFIGDANGDGLNDVVFQIPSVVNNTPNSFLIFDQQSGVLATPPITVDTSIDIFTGAYAVADINGDGLNDLIFENQGTLGIYLQSSSHNFSNPILYPLQISPTDNFGISQKIEVLDINNDGVPDIMLSDSLILIGVKPGQ